MNHARTVMGRAQSMTQSKVKGSGVQDVVVIGQLIRIFPGALCSWSGWVERYRQSRRSLSYPNVDEGATRGDEPDILSFLPTPNRIVGASGITQTLSGRASHTHALLPAQGDSGGVRDAGRARAEGGNPLNREGRRQPFERAGPRNLSDGRGPGGSPRRGDSSIDLAQPEPPPAWT